MLKDKHLDELVEQEGSLNNGAGYERPSHGSHMLHAYLNDLSEYPKLEWEEQVVLFKKRDAIASRIKERLAPVYSQTPEHAKKLKRLHVDEIVSLLPYIKDRNYVPEKKVQVRDMDLKAMKEFLKSRSIRSGAREKILGIYSDLGIALNTIIHHNLALVVDFIKGKYGMGDPDVMNLIQVGNDGMGHAAEKFDLGRGARFSTYATPWIRQKTAYFKKENLNREIHIPVHKVESIGKLKKREQELANSLGRNPTPYEIERRFNGARELVEHDHRFLYLNAPQSREREGGEISDNFADPNSEPYSVLQLRQVKKDVNESLDHLHPDRKVNAKWKKILEMRFGLNGYRAMTLDETAKRNDLSRESIRKIEVKAFNNVRTYWRRTGQRIELKALAVHGASA